MVLLNYGREEGYLERNNNYFCLYIIIVFNEMGCVLNMGHPCTNSLMWDYVLDYHKRDHSGRVKCGRLVEDRGSGFYFAVVDEFNVFRGFVLVDSKSGALRLVGGLGFRLYGVGIPK